MLYLQLARQGYVDAQTLAETLEIPNFGAFPAMPLPPLSPPPPGVELALIGQGIQSVVAGGPFPQYTDPVTQRTFVLDPASGQLMEIRTPVTVLERLAVQNQMGIGQVVSPAGRKASGGAPPSAEEKSDGEGGTRSTITESTK